MPNWTGDDPNDPTRVNNPEYHWVPRPEVGPGAGQWQFASSNPADNAVTGYADPSGLMANAATTHTPGGDLATGQADESRARMAPLLAQLHGQAQYGNGAWQQQLAQGTQQANATASALGQSQPGLDPMAAQRGMANAQAGNAQRAAGQGEILRAQTQQAAQGELANIYGAQGGLDAQQATAQAAARQGVREQRLGVTQAANEANNGTYKGVGDTLVKILTLGLAGGGKSDGGPIPGKARVFGDSEANDTVPAMLSPGEVVIPRSIALAPNAPDAAARFVAAVKAQKPQHFDDGGRVADPRGDYATGTTGNEVLAQDSSVQGGGNYIGAYGIPGIAYERDAASTVNGGLLKTGPYNDTRAASLANSQALLASAAGRGPSVAPQQLRNANDDAIAQAMQAGAGMRGGGRGVGEAAAIGGGAAVAQQGAGQAAGVRMQEADAAGRQAANALQQQRAQDLAFAQAQQQAAWRNSMINAGIGIQQQGALRSLLSGAGQAAATAADIFGSDRSGPDFGNFDLGGYGATAGAGDLAPVDTGGGFDPGIGFDSSGVGYAARGGMVPGETNGDDKRAAAFLRALRGRAS
jgi:hypothetical protein